jgi:hypothetical protein
MYGLWLSSVNESVTLSCVGTAEYLCDKMKITDKCTFWQLAVNFRDHQMIWHLSGPVSARFKEMYCIYNIHIFLPHHFSGHLTQFSHPEDGQWALITTQFQTPKHDHQLKHTRAACLTSNVLEDIHHYCRLLGNDTVQCDTRLKVSECLLGITAPIDTKIYDSNISTWQVRRQRWCRIRNLGFNVYINYNINTVITNLSQLVIYTKNGLSKLH